MSPLPDTASEGSTVRIASIALARCASSRSTTITARAALHSDVLEADLLLAQLAAHRVGEIGQALVQHRAQVGFEQEVGAAAQVEAEIDAALLVPARQVVEHGWPADTLGSANSTASAVKAMMAMTCQRGRLSMRPTTVLAATSCRRTGCPAGSCARPPARPAAASACRPRRIPWRRAPIRRGSGCR